MSNIIGFPNANVAAITPAINANVVIARLAGSFFMRIFTANEIINEIQGYEQYDVINVRMKPFLADAESITDITTGTNTYDDLNYGKVPVTLDEAFSSKYKYTNAQKSANVLEYEKDGADASGAAIVRKYERTVFKKMRTSVGASALGTVGNALNKKVFDTVRVAADNLNLVGERIYVALQPDAYSQLGNIPEFATSTYRIAETIQGLNEDEFFTIGGNLNMTFVKTTYIDRPVPATDPIAIAFVKRSVVTPIRSVALSGTGVDIVKTLGNIAMTHTTLPVSDARLGVSILKKNECLFGFKEIPTDINAAGATSGVALWLIRGGN
jgi:hypothetical protein